MQHLSVEPPAFFHRGPSPLARLTICGLASLVLLFADTRFHYLEHIRQVAAIVLYPVQRAAQVPGEALAWIGENKDMLKNQGFRHVDVFFKWYNFCGILAMK